MTDSEFRNRRVPVKALPGLTLDTRPDLCDETVIDEVIHRDGYRLRTLDLHGATVLDLGAHIGVFSTFCAVLGAARIVSVEPQPENLELLADNVAPFDQITVLPMAVGATEGTARIAGESGGTHTEPDHPDAIDVPQTTLAHLLDHVVPGRVHLLKLDMEGGEVDALLGCDHTRLARVQRIVMETHGPAVCPWVDHPRVGELVEHLLPTHNVEASGFPTHLGMLFATRNGCDSGW